MNKDNDSAPLIHAVDFGALPDTGDNMLEPLRAALRKAASLTGAVLIIPPGEYILSDPGAVELQERVMTTLPGHISQDELFKPGFQYVTGLDFSGSHDLTVMAENVSFIIDGWMEPISIRGCSDVTIKGLTIDYKRPPHSSGIIERANRLFIDVRFDPWCRVTETSNFCRIMIFDKTLNSFVGRAIYHKKVRELSPGLLRFYGLFRSFKDVGRIFNGWHSFHFRPAILIYEARDIKLIDVTIHSQPGMGIVGHMSENIDMLRLKIIPAPGRIISTNTDATHFASCRGTVSFRDCSFAGQGDDSTNVHTYYWDIINQKKNCITMTLNKKFETHSVLPDYPLVGDTMALVDRNSLEEMHSLKVIGCKLDSKTRSCEVELEGLPRFSTEAFLLTNLSACPRLRFLGCRVNSHRARSVLVKTRDVLIEDCDIENTSGTAIHIGAEGNWMEGVGSQDVVIRNNHIRNCGLGGSWDGTIDRASGIAVHVNARNKKVPGIHKRILIQGNHISGGYRAVSIRGAEDVSCIDNTFNNLRLRPVMTRAVRRVSILNNKGIPDSESKEGTPGLPVVKEVSS